MEFLMWETWMITFILGWLALGVHRAFFASMSKLPGPWYTRFTDFYLMYREFTAQRRAYIHDLHQKFGPVIRIGPNEASFTSVEALSEIYQSQGTGYDKSTFYNNFMQYGQRTTFSTLVKKDHNIRKRHIAATYANTNIMNPKVLGGINERANAFLRRCEESGEKGLDVYTYLHCYALDCVSFQMLHPYGTKSIEGTDMDIMEELAYDSSIVAKYANYRWPILASFLERVFRPIVAPLPLSTQYIFSACKKSDLSDHSLASKLRNTNGALKEIQIAAECMNLLFAGIDSTGDTLCFLMHQLSKPESTQFQNRLIEELAANTEKAFHELPYLEAVVKEGLRCFPPVPMSIPRYVPNKGRVIDGYFIPSGCIVSCQAWSLHRLNNEIFVRGEEFLPERWLDPTAVVEMNRLFFSFGAGGRICAGRHLATAEMKYLLRGVYSRFKTSIAPDMKGSMELSDQAISSRPLGQTCKLVFEPIA